MTTSAGADQGSDRPAVAVVLVTHNGRRWLPSVLGALPAALRVVPDTDASADPDSDASNPDASNPQMADPRLSGTLSPSSDQPPLLPEADEESALWVATLSAVHEPLEPASVVHIAVDTGSTDDSAALVSAAGFTLLEAPASTPFGRAVASAATYISENHPEVQWLWLLHDDSAPEPEALTHLLSVAVHQKADVVGPKVHTWSGPKVITERGIRLSSSGRRYYGVDAGELDQGQYDHVGGDPVLAVSTAGMLISTRAWSALGGFDPALTSSGDDIDLCRRARRAGFSVMLSTRASIRHARAMARGRRRDSITDHPGADARYGAMHVLLAHSGPIRVWLSLVRLTFGSGIRAGVQLLQRDVRGARDQIEAVTRLYTHPSRLRVSRARVAAAGPPDPAERDLFVPARERWRIAFASITAVLEQLTAVPEDEDSEIFLPEQESENLSLRRRHVWKRIAHRPLSAVAAVLTLLALVRGWGLLFSSAPLSGGRLADGGVQGWSLLQSYASGWHDIGRGLATPSPSWMMVIGVLSIPFFGHVSGLLAFLLVFFVPLMVVSTALALRMFITSAWVSTVTAVLIALSPVFTTAVQRGDVATLVLALSAPLVIRLGLRAVRKLSWPATFGAAMCLAVILSFSVIAWLQAVLLLLVVALAALRSARRAVLLRWASAAVASLGLVMPWPLTFIGRPWAALLDAGNADAGVASDRWAIITLSSHSTHWLAVGAFAAAMLALLRPRARQAVAGVWALALIPISVWILCTHVSLQVTGVNDEVHPSAESAVAFLAIAVGICIALGCDGLLAEIRAADVSVVHIGAAVGALAIAVSAVVPVAGFFSASANLVHRGQSLTVPEFVAIDLQRDQRPRALVLTADDPNPVDYFIASAPTSRLGDSDILRTSVPDVELSSAVATLVSAGEPFAGARVKAAAVLAGAAIKYVVLPDAGAGAGDIATAVAATPGLRPMTTAGAQQHNWVWRVNDYAGRASFARAGSTRAKRLTAFSVGAGPGELNVTGTSAAPAARAGTYYLADATSHWRAQMDGRDVVVRQTADGIQAVDVRGTAQLSARIWRDDVERRWWITGQVLAWLLALIMALPTRRVSAADDSEDGD